MNWMLLTENDQNSCLAAEVFGREQEIYAYELNIAKYTFIVDSIHDEWTRELEEYRECDALQLSRIVDDSTFEKLSRLQFKDEMIARLKTERSELSKAMLVMKSLLPLLPAPEVLRSALEASKCQTLP